MIFMRQIHKIFHILRAGIIDNILTEEELEKVTVKLLKIYEKENREDLNFRNETQLLMIFSILYIINMSIDLFCQKSFIYDIINVITFL
jgi:hypothetical protein